MSQESNPPLIEDATNSVDPRLLANYSSTAKPYFSFPKSLFLYLYGRFIGHGRGRRYRLDESKPASSRSSTLLLMLLCLSISEGLMTDELRSFLELNLPKGKEGKKAKFSMGVAEPKLGSNILEETKIPCQSDLVGSGSWDEQLLDDLDARMDCCSVCVY